MKLNILCFVVLLAALNSFELRNHAQTNQDVSGSLNNCKKIEKTSKSYNNNCEFRYFVCE